MHIHQLDMEAKKRLVDDLDLIPHASDLEVVVAVLRAHRRNPSFKIINTVLLKHGVAMSEREYKALLAEQRKQPRGALGARGSPPANGPPKVTTHHPEGSALPDTHAAAPSQTESAAARVWRTALSNQPMKV